MAQTTGIAFPLILTSGKHTLVSGSDLIEASIKTILTWALRTRFFNGQFGSRSNELLEEPNDGILVKLMRKFVIDSVIRWERRISLLSLTITRPSSERLVVDLTFLIKETNISSQLTNTFYTN